MYTNQQVTQQGLDESRTDADLRVPSTLRSAGMSFLETFTALPRIGFDMFNALNGLPARNPLDDSFDVFNKSMETPNLQWGQKTIDFFASGIGYLNPINSILVNPSISAVKYGSNAISRILPEGLDAISRTPIRNFGLKMLPETVGGAAEHLLSAAAIGTSITIPESLLDNYNPETNKFEIYGAAKQAFSNGVLTLALDAIPVTAGVIFGKHKRLFNKEYKNPMPGDERMHEFDKALENNEISKDDHAWIKTYLEDPNNIKKLREDGLNILKKEGYPLDSDGKSMLMSLIKKDHFDNFQSAMLDQISSGANGKFSSSLSDYIAATGMDFMVSENKKFLDGLHGYVEFMENRLLRKPENLSIFKEYINKSDLEHIDVNHELSQKNILKRLKDVNYKENLLPHALPENLRIRAKQEKDILNIKKDLSRFKKLSKKNPDYEERINNLSIKLKELKSSRKKPLHPDAELKSLEKYFIDNPVILDNFNLSNEYHRLLDLSHFSTKADALLHHIDIKKQYETQTAYKDMIKFLNDIIGSNVEKFANPNNVISYMKNRYESVGPLPGDMSHRGNIRNQNEVPINQVKGAHKDLIPENEIHSIQDDFRDSISNDEEVIKLGEQDIDKVNSDEISKEFKIKRERYEQFKVNTDALYQLLSCELGSKDG